MNKNENVILDWSGDGGIGSESVCKDLLHGHSADDFIQSGCDFFDEAFGRNDEKVSEKEGTIEANRVLITHLNEKISELRRLVDTKTKENNQLEAEIQILKAKANNGNALTVHERHALAQWCFLDAYPIDWFCRLFFQTLPHEEVSAVFYGQFERLGKKLRGLVEVDPDSGIKTLFRYREGCEGHFTIKAYEVACKRLGLRVDVPVFTWRDRYSLDEINEAYLRLPEVNQGRERGAQLVDEYKRKHERPCKPTNDQDRELIDLCNGVLADMPTATITDQNEEIRHRSIAIRPRKIAYSTADRWRKTTIEANKARRLN